MRELKFRGLSVDGSKWHTGNFFYWIKRGVEIPIIGDGVQNGSVMGFEVITETVVQFTGLTDKNGVEIYEGDIVLAKHWNPSKYQIEFIEGGFCGTFEGCNMPTDINHWYDSTGCAIEVIGNIHKHPHLINQLNITAKS